MTDPQSSARQELQILLQRALQGDPQALSDLLAKVRPLLFRQVASVLTGSVGAKLSDSSVVQETMMRIANQLSPAALSGPPGFRGQTAAEFLGWIRVIARHTALEALRKHSAQKRDVGREISGEKLFAGMADGARPDQSVLDAESTLWVASLLEKLPPQQNQILTLRYLQGVSFAEIAQTMGLKPGAVRMAHLRALKKLCHDMKEVSE